MSSLKHFIQSLNKQICHTCERKKMYLIDKYNEKTSLKTNSDLTFRQETSKIAALAVKAVGKHDSPQPGL